MNHNPVYCHFCREDLSIKGCFTVTGCEACICEECIQDSYDTLMAARKKRNPFKGKPRPAGPVIMEDVCS